MAALAASASPALADSDTSQLLIVWGAGNSTCARYVDAAKAGRAASLPYEQWLDGYITARNQTNPDVLDYAGAIDRQELLASLARFCRERPNGKFYEAADRLLTDLVKSGRVKYSKTAR